MTRFIPSTLLLVCLTLASLLYTAPALAAPTYDVSYLWTRHLDNARNYRNKVASVLGPQVGRHLKVVEKGALYGVIYHRRGSSDSTARVAARHSRLLKKRGLERAAALRSINWTLAGQAPTPKSPTPAAVTTAASKVTKSAPAAEASAEALKKAADEETRRSQIEAAVEKYVKDLRARRILASDERTAWSVFDFTTGEKLVDINEDAKFQAASLVKPFFAMAYFHKVRQGKLRYGAKSRRHMERMIQRSNNYSTNWIMRQVGGPAAVQRILHQNYPGIFENTEIVEYIPAGGRTYRNKASVHDYSRFLYALWKENIPGANEIKRLMALPGKDRIYTGARSIPKGTKVYNKTGSTAQLCGDMGILVVRGRDGKRYPYTIIGVIEKDARARNYTRWIRSRGNVIRQVSNIVYRGISRHHGLKS